MKKKVFAIYRGDSLIDMGTINELIERNSDISEKYLRWVIYARNIPKRVAKKNGLVAVLVEG